MENALSTDGNWEKEMRGKKRTIMPPGPFYPPGCSTDDDQYWKMVPGVSYARFRADGSTAGRRKCTGYWVGDRRRDKKRFLLLKGWLSIGKYDNPPY